MSDVSQRPPIAAAPLTVILLAHNDGPDIEEVVTAWMGRLNGLDREYEVLLVDDGSTDNTVAQADNLAQRFARLRVLRHTSPAGLGPLLRTGIAAAQYPLLLYTTCDKQYHPADLQRFLESIDKVDLVTGYRVGRPLPGWLVWWDRLFRLFVRVVFGLSMEARDCWLGWQGYGRRWRARWIFGVRVRDPECAFRLFRREIFARIPIQTNELAHIEILAKANFLGLWMAEVPVTCLAPRARKEPAETSAAGPREARELFRMPDFGPTTLPPAMTTTVLRAAQESSTFGEPTTFTAQVYPALEKLPGAVAVLVDGVEQARLTPEKGQATFSTATLDAGLHTIAAVYEGNGCHAGSTSSSRSHFVKPAPSHVSLVLAGTEPAHGQEILLTAKVAPCPPATGCPAGKVLFKDGDISLGEGTLAEGTAALAVSLHAGNHSLSAAYHGSGNFSGAASEPLSLTITVPTQVALRLGNEPAPGQATTLLATVNALAPLPEVPVGRITFKDGDVLLGEADLSGGAATLSVNLDPGQHTLIAVYQGTAPYAGSASEPLVALLPSPLPPV